MTPNEYHIKVQAEPAAYWFIIGAVALMSALCLISVADSAPFLGADEYALLIVGSAGVFASFRAHRYFTKPNLSVTGDGLVHRPFWKRTGSINFADVTDFELKTEEIEPRNYLRKRPFGTPTGKILIIHRLHVTLTDGTRRAIVLPGFNQHTIDQITAAIEHHSNHAVTRAPFGQ